MTVNTEYFQSLATNPGSSIVYLLKEDECFVGVFNGLSYWGKVFTLAGELVEELENWDEESQEMLNFSINAFEYLAGYSIS